MSKGSRQRPRDVDQTTFDANWHRIFKTPQERDDAIAEDEAFRKIAESNSKKPHKVNKQ